MNFNRYVAQSLDSCMDYSNHLQSVLAKLSLDIVRQKFQGVLKRRNWTYDDLIQEFIQYCNDPIGYILSERSELAKVRNDVVTCFHILRNLWVPTFTDTAKLYFYSNATAFSHGDGIGHFDLGCESEFYRIDPGVGALQSTFDVLNQTQGQVGLDPIWLSGIVMTHHHPDHVGGLTGVFERMRGSGLLEVEDHKVVGNKTAMRGHREFNRGSVLDLYQSECVTPIELAPGESSDLGIWKIAACPASHIEAVGQGREPIGNSLGYRFESRYGNIYITGDTEWCDTLPSSARGADVTIAFMTQEAERAGSTTQKSYGLSIAPRSSHRQFLGELGVIKLLKEAAPTKLLVISDLGDQLMAPCGSFEPLGQEIVERIRKASGYGGEIILAKPGLEVEITPGSCSYRYHL